MKKKNKVKIIVGFFLIIILTVAGGIISYQGIGKKHTGISPKEFRGKRPQAVQKTPKRFE